MPQDHETLLTTTIAFERDIFALRRYGRAAAEAAGLEDWDQVRFATALSELGRDLMRPAPMRAQFTVSTGEPVTLCVVLSWLDERAPSRESLDAVDRLISEVSYEPEHGRVVLGHMLPRGTEPPAERAGRIRDTLRAGHPSSLTEDLRAQTHDLIVALEVARRQAEELQRLNQELEETNQGVVALYTELSGEMEETNRGVVALYAELDQKSRQLREASESKTRFWLNVSHELRTPVNSVIGLARLLLDPGSEPLSEAQHRQVSLMGSAGSMLLVLVDELLDVAKAESGRLEPQLAPVDLNALLGQLRGLMAGTAPSAEVALVVPELPELPERPVIVTDEVMLTRILRNLLSNSLKFTRRGTVRLDVRREAPQWLVFTVSDTGVGIPADQQTKVFEEFYQVPGAHQRNRSGTGLGLPYARRLAGILGGELELESESGRGTSVSLRLPAVREAEPVARRLATLVMADDDPGFRETLRPALERLAGRIVELEDGRLVAETVRRERPDAVVLDLYMPGVDGYAVLAELAADPGLCEIPVVVVTSAQVSTADSERLSHAAAVLPKTGLTAHRLATLLAPGGDGAGGGDPGAGEAPVGERDD